MNKTNNKKTIRLSESELTSLIKESINDIIGDISDYSDDSVGDKYAYDEFDRQSEKLGAGDVLKGGGKLDKLVRNNRNWQKWYDKMHKHADNLNSWDASDSKDRHDWDSIKGADEDAINDITNWNVYDDNLGGTLDDEYWKNESVVRVSESQLQSIIKESVHSILTELNWKTYTSSSRLR